MDAIFEKQVELCRIWISMYCYMGYAPRKYVRRNHSYHLKHVVEDFFNEYIPNEAFKTAAREIFGVEWKLDGLNDVYNFTVSSPEDRSRGGIRLDIDKIIKIKAEIAELRKA